MNSSENSLPADAAVQSPVTEVTASPDAGGATAGAVPSLREDQIQNAVAFLTHPKVRESPLATKRSFLERKGLTAAEIDEAFNRVPQQPAAQPTTSQPVGTAGAPAGLITYQPQGSTQSTVQQPQYAASPAAPTQGLPGHPQQAGALVPAHHTQAVAASQPPEPLRWTQVFLGVGVVAAGLYAVKAVVVPKVMDWYTAWSDRGRAARELQQRQAAALIEAADALKSCQAEIKSNSDALAELVATLKEQQAQLTANDKAKEARERYASDRIEAHLEDLRSMVRSNTRLGSDTYKPHIGRFGEGASTQPSTTVRMFDHGAFNQQTGHSNGHTQGNSARNGISAQPWQHGPPPQSPWLSGKTTNGNGYNGNGYNISSNDSTTGNNNINLQQSTIQPSSQRAAPPAPPDECPYPPSFHEVMEMVSKGITPPNVRTDIVDTPPDPSRPLPGPAAQPQPKPWLRSGNSSPQPTDTYAGLGTVGASHVGQGSSAFARPAMSSYNNMQDQMSKPWSKPYPDAPSYHVSQPTYSPASSQSGTYEQGVQGAAHVPGSKELDAGVVSTHLLPEQQQFSVPQHKENVDSLDVSEAVIPAGVSLNGSMHGSIFKAGNAKSAASAPVTGSVLSPGAPVWKPPPPPLPTITRNRSSSSITSATGAGNPGPNVEDTNAQPVVPTSPELHPESTDARAVASALE